MSILDTIPSAEDFHHVETTDQLAAEPGRARSTIIQHLARLRELGIVRHVDPKCGGHWEVKQGDIE